MAIVCRVGAVPPMCFHQSVTLTAQFPTQVPSKNELLGASFQNALRAFWDEARTGFGVHWYAYTDGNRNPRGLCDALKCIGV